MWRHFHLTHHYRIRCSTLPLHVAALSSDPSIHNTKFYVTFSCGGTCIWPIITEYDVLLYLYMWRHFHLTHHYIIRCLQCLYMWRHFHLTHQYIIRYLQYLYMWWHFHLTHHYRIRCSTLPLHVAALSSDPSIHNTKFYVTFTCGGTCIWPIITEYDVLLYLYMWRHFHLTHYYRIQSSTVPLHAAALSSDPSLQFS
jgi:hypothetical protein